MRSVSLAVLLAASCAAEPRGPMNPDPEQARPIAAADSVFIEDMTWLEVRDALRAGKDTVIVAAGGIEQNGPYVVTGKHNYIVRANAEVIARKLGNALVAPVLGFVPEGDYDPPTDHMVYPGTIGVTEETYRLLLRDICLSLRVHGFRHIVLIGDHGLDQDGMEQVAREWKGGRTSVHYIAEYYDEDDGVTKWLEARGLRQKDEGLHDDFVMEAQLMTVDPALVRMKERLAARLFRINGVDLQPAAKTIDWGRKIVEYRTDLAVAAIRRATGGAGGR